MCFEDSCLCDPLAVSRYTSLPSHSMQFMNPEEFSLLFVCGLWLFLKLRQVAEKVHRQKTNQPVVPIDHWPSHTAIYSQPFNWKTIFHKDLKFLVLNSWSFLSCFRRIWQRLYSDPLKCYCTALGIFLCFIDGNSVNRFCTAVMRNVGPERKETQLPNVRVPQRKHWHVGCNLHNMIWRNFNVQWPI